jgi:hypothetical protein
MSYSPQDFGNQLSGYSVSVLDMRLLLLLAALPLWGADDANQILKRFAEADVKNWEQARQYAYTQERTNFAYDKNGKPVQNGAAVWEVIFIEGLEYKKLISEDGKPLDARAQAREEKKLQQTAEERRKERRAGAFHPTVRTGSIEDLLALFDNRLLGEEEIRGRKAWVIESTPQSGHVPANKYEKEVLSFRHKLWIDEVENVKLKTVKTVVGDHIYLKPGSTMTFEFEKINDDAWLPVRQSDDFHLQFAKFIRPSGRSDYQYSKFRKFDVQSTITMEPSK